jgi:hypothetical protein
VSEKEQAKALKLLVEWLAQMGPAAPEELRRNTEEFLRLTAPEPESHGQRRA